MTFAVLLGGFHKPGLPLAIASGEYPGVEYLNLLQEYGGDLVNFDNVTESRSWIVRLLRNRMNVYWGLAALARLRESRWQAFFTTGEDVGLPLALIQRLTGGRTPVAILFHGSYLGSPKAAGVLRLVRGLSTVRFLCLSETLRRRLIDVHGIDADRAVNIGYGVDTEFFQPVGTPLSGQIMAAGMAKRDYRTLVSAVAGMSVTVKIAADSAWFKQGIDIQGETHPDNVEVGSCGDYPGLRRLYAESAFAVVPLYDAVHACGYAVIAEAMAMGKPVITTRIAAHSDFVVEGETGFYVPPGDAAALKERIAYLLDRPELTLEMGRKARRLMEERYSLDAYTGRIAAAMGLSGSSRERVSRGRSAGVV